jgi:hypothetical protein
MFLGFRSNFFGSFSKSFFNSPFILDLKPSMMISKQKREGFPWIYLDLFGDSNVRSLSKLRLLLVNFETENKSVFWLSSSSNCDLASISPFFSSSNCDRTISLKLCWNCSLQFDDDDSFESLRIAKQNHLNLELFSLCNCWIWAFCDEFCGFLVVNWWIWETLWRWLIWIAVVLVCYGGDWILLRWWLEREILLEVSDGDVSLSNWESSL